MSTIFQEQVRLTWEVVPDWIEALARSCDESSQRKTASMLGISPAAVNLLIHNKYAPRSHRGIEILVRNRLMAAPVLCPVQGEIDRTVCSRYQAMPLNTHNPAQVQIYRACRGGCPHYLSNSPSKHPVNGVRLALAAHEGVASPAPGFASSKRLYGQNPQRPEK